VDNLFRREGWFGGSLLLLAGIAVIDRLTPESSLATGCAAPAFLAAATCTARRTAVVAAASLVTGVVLIALNDEDALSNAARVAVLLLAAGLAPALARMRENRERQIRDLTRAAKVAQDAVLTPVPATAGMLRFASAYESASREALIGGDLFAVVTTDRETRLLVGDVRGKGLDAVKTAALVLALFREAAYRCESLNDVAAYCDERLRPHIGDEDFVTALFASIDDTGYTEIVSRGHPAPLLAHASTLTSLDVPEPAGPLGLAVDPGATSSQRLRLEPGDRLLFFTDGLAEARDRQGQFIDVNDLVAGLGTTEFDATLPAVLSRLHSAAPSIDDDLALLLVEYAAPGRPRVATTAAAH
jgi:serine phosphatase RsbU (regulator of sigma subunit)